MSFTSKYGLGELQVGETKRFYSLSDVEIKRIRRSAHNYNLRADMHFITRNKDGVFYVTRLR